MKRPNSCGYYSSYDRGLYTLLTLWPKIREQIPTASLDVAYGWDMYLIVRGKDEYYQKTQALLEELKDQGVTEHGRMSHEDLAKLMKTTQVWTYPTEWTETCCITALKVQEAGMWPVTTRIAALDETVVQGDKLDVLNIYTNEYAQNKFVKLVVSALREKKTTDPVPNVDWSDVANEWMEIIGA